MNNNFKYKTMFTWFLVFALFLVGCGSDDGSDVSTNDNNGETSDSDDVTITFSLWDQFDDEIIAAFNEEHPNINVEIVQTPDSDYSQKVNTSLVGGTAADVILSFEADIHRFADNGYIENLDDYVAESDVVSMDELIPAVSQLTDDMNGAYGLPWTLAYEIMYYNKDMFDEAGMDYPTNDWTYEDFNEAAKELTIRDGNSVSQWGADALTFRGLWWSTIGAFGDEIYADGEIQLGEGLEKTLAYQDKLTNVDMVSPEPTSGSEMADLFASGRAAMSRNGSWMIANYLDNDFNWDIAPLPTGERDYNALHTGFFTINSDSDHKDESWKFIEFMMSHKGQTMLSELYNNVSAVESIAAEGAYQVEGENGPTNWETFDIAGDTGRFGYVLINAGITNDLVSQFEAVILGEQDAEDVIENSADKAQEQLDKLN